MLCEWKAASFRFASARLQWTIEHWQRRCRQDSVLKNQDRLLRLILEAVDVDSPLSTRQVKEACELQGRLNEPQFNKTTKYLWQNLCLIAFGEINDSSFPSLGYASPKILFEDLWVESQKISVAEAEKEIFRLLKSQPEVLKWLGKIKKS